MADGETRLRRLDRCADVMSGSAALAAALDEADTKRGAALDGTSFLRVEQPVEHGAPLAWLRGFAGLPRMFWSDREDTFELAGIGTCAAAEGKHLEVLDELQTRVMAGEAADRMRLIGTARFDLDREPDPEWVSFRRARFVLPLVELRREGDAWTLAVNLKVEGGKESGWYDVQRRTARKALLQGAAPLDVPETITPCGADDDPALWAERIGALLERIQDGSLEKAVLARRVSRVMELDAVDVLEALRTTQPNAYHLLVQPAVGEAFVAASPERLYRRRGQALETEALAGTRARTLDAAADEELARELAASVKDGTEHALVRGHVVAALEPLCDEVDGPGTPAVRTLAALLLFHRRRRPTPAGTAPDAGCVWRAHRTRTRLPSRHGALRSRALRRPHRLLREGRFRGRRGVTLRHPARTLGTTLRGRGHRRRQRGRRRMAGDGRQDERAERSAGGRR